MKSNANKPRAYAYIRWSSAVQGKGDSEARQQSPLETFTEATGVEVVETITDRGKSAYRGSNALTGHLKGLLERINSGEIRKGDYLVIESIDRLTRQRLIISAEMIQNILKKGVRIYTTIDGKCYEVDDPNRDLETLIMVQVIAKRANEESETKSKRVTAAWGSRVEKAKQGQAIIKRGKSIPFGLRFEDGQFVRQEQECQEVKKLFSLMLDVGMNTALQTINTNSLRKWTTGHLQKIFASKSIIGCLTINKVTYSESGASRKVKTQTIENYYPNIIDPTLFYRVRDRMAERKVKNFSGKRSERSYNIFQHVIFCQSCGSNMHYDHRGTSYQDRVYPHFKCETKQNKAVQCTNDRIRFEYVFRGLLEYLNGVKLMADAERTRGDLQNEIFGYRADRKETLNKFLGHKKETTTQLADQIKGLTSVNSLNSKAKELLREKELELSTARTTYENLEQSVGRFVKQSQGNIPVYVLESLRSAEKALQQAKDEVETARSKIIFDEGLEKFTVENIIDLYRTESGRTRLNSFLKANHVRLHVEHDKASKLLKISVYQEVSGKAIKVSGHSIHTGRPKLKRIKGQKVKEFNILEQYGIDLQTILNEEKQVSPLYMQDRFVSGKNRKAYSGFGVDKV